VGGAGAQSAEIPYVGGMTRFLFILLMIVMLAVLGVLGAGMLGVVRGGDARRSNALMRWRVLLQGLAILIFVLLLATRR
jgi:hypothetical protein